MAYRFRIANRGFHDTGFAKDPTKIALVIIALLMLIFADGLMMWMSSVTDRNARWNERCSENESRLHLIESMVEQGDWQFDADVKKLSKKKRVELLASKRFIHHLFGENSDANNQIKELSEYRYCRKKYNKVNIRNAERELLAVFDGRALHDCRELSTWQQVVDGLIKNGYWAELERKRVKFHKEIELGLTLHEKPKFHLNSKTGERVEWSKSHKYRALIPRIGACTGYSSYFMLTDSDGSFSVFDLGDVDNELDWVRANPEPDW